MRSRNNTFSTALPLSEIPANTKQLWFLAMMDTSSILVFAYTVIKILPLFLYLLTKFALPNRLILKIVLKASNFQSPFNLSHAYDILQKSETAQIIGSKMNLTLAKK